MEYVRVRDKVTGHHYTTAWVDESRHQVLDKQEALDSEGLPLPYKPNTPKAETSAKKES